MSEKTTRNRSLGPAAGRLIKALAEEAPRMLTREEFLNSESLKSAHNKPHDSQLEDNETAAAAKTLGRLIAKEGNPPIREVLIIDRNSDDVPTHEVGLVGVSLSLTELRNAATPSHGFLRKLTELISAPISPQGIIKKISELISASKIEGAPISQEEILEKISEDSRAWGLQNSDQGFPLVYVSGVYIIHGSAEYDIIIFVNYSDTETYMRYVRDVVQEISAVQKTHTMQVAHGMTNSPLF